MTQWTFSDAEYAGKRKQTRREVFLVEMEQVVPWKALLVTPRGRKLMEALAKTPRRHLLR